MSLAQKRLLDPVQDQGKFLEIYPWLLCEWPANKWTVSDPFSSENPQTTVLVFDSALSPGNYLTDKADLVEDVKRSLAFSVIYSGKSRIVGPRITSLSGMKTRVQCMKRIGREMQDMGSLTFADLDAGLMKLLLNRLAQREVISINYEHKIVQYFAETPVDAWMIRWPDKTKRNPATVDRAAICLLLGLDDQVAKSCEKVRAIFYEANQRAESQFTDVLWSQPPAVDSRTNLSVTISFEQLVDHLNALEAYYLQSQTFEEFLNHPLRVAPFTEKASQVASMLVEESRAGRTRNIPVASWMHMMDAAARFVLDYAEPLMELDREARTRFDECTVRQGEHAAGKATGLWLRSQQAADGKYSPFPLSSYANYVERSGGVKYDEAYVLRFAAEIGSGKKPAEIKKQLNLRKSQYDYLKKVIAEKDVPKGTGLSLHMALYGFVPLASILIILAFTAGRESAIKSLTAGCIKKKFGELYINIFIAKNPRRYEDLPTVELVALAVKVLEDLSEEARDIRGDDLIIWFNSIIKRDVPQRFRWDNTINRFADWVDLPRDENGDYFRFSEHQFRRFYAMLFYYRHDSKYKDIVLFRFLRHVDWSRTTTYLTEAIQGSVFKDIEKQRAAEMIHWSATGQAAGPMALEFRSQFPKAFQIKTEAQAILALESLDQESYVIDFVPDGVCFGRTPGKELCAKCGLADQSGITHVMLHRATSGFCNGCPNLLTTDNIKVDRMSFSTSLSDSRILAAAAAGDSRDQRCGVEK